MKYIAVLRGINVGGKRKMPMAELKSMLEELKYNEVSTYIQSGNVAFCHEEGKVNAEIEREIETAIQKHFDFDVPVIVRNETDINSIILSNEYAAVYDIERLHYTFFKEEPHGGIIEDIVSEKFLPDSFKIFTAGAYIYCSAGYSDTKLNNSFFEKKLGVGCTTRNWKTMLKLQSMLKI